MALMKVCTALIRSSRASDSAFMTLLFCRMSQLFSGTVMIRTAKPAKEAQPSNLCKRNKQLYQTEVSHGQHSRVKKDESDAQLERHFQQHGEIGEHADGI